MAKNGDLESRRKVNGGKKNFEKFVLRKGEKRRRCQAYKANSVEQCSSIAINDTNYCKWHGNSTKHGAPKPRKKVLTSNPKESGMISRLEDRAANLMKTKKDLLKVSDDLAIAYQAILDFVRNAEDLNLPAVKFVPHLVAMFEKFNNMKHKQHEMKYGKKVTISLDILSVIFQEFHIVAREAADGNIAVEKRFKAGLEKMGDRVFLKIRDHG